MRCGGNGNGLGFEEGGFFAVDAEESEYLDNGDDDAHCAKEERTEARNRHSSNYEQENRSIPCLRRRETRRDDLLVGDAKESTPATRETIRNCARIA